MNAAMIAAALALAAPAGWAMAQSSAAQPGSQTLNLGSEDGGPIEILADGGLEWQRDAKAYIARGNASASRGDFKVEADTLIAYYREKADGGTEIYRLDADGNVRLLTADATVTGDKAAYDVAQKVAIVTGDKLQLTTATDRISARKSLEYWQERNLAVARGEAQATRAENTLRSDVLMARFAEDQTGEMAMRLVDATGGVVIQTPAELVRGSQGRFDVQTNIATLTGDVRLTRGETQLNGDRAEVNMDTGVSRLFTAAGADGKRRVRGVVTPDDLSDAKPAGQEGSGQ
jgi:lipopolysaccharide export system protein LptA